MPPNFRSLPRHLSEQSGILNLYSVYFPTRGGGVYTYVLYVCIYRCSSRISSSRNSSGEESALTDALVPTPLPSEFFLFFFSFFLFRSFVREWLSSRLVRRPLLFSSCGLFFFTHRKVRTFSVNASQSFPFHCVHERVYVYTSLVLQPL